MVMFISSRNERILSISPMTGGDFVHDCSDSNNNMSNEDVRIISTIAGDNNELVSTGKLKGDINHQGISNRAGTRARLHGEDPETVTSRGNNADITRSRTYYEYIKKN